MKAYNCSVYIHAFASVTVEANSEEEAKLKALKAEPQEYTVQIYTIEPEEIEKVESVSGEF